MEQAKVASLKRQSEVEVARAETTVAQTQLAKAKNILSQLDGKYVESEKLVADLKENLAKAEAELAARPRPAKK